MRVVLAELTQKPVALLERILAASSDEGDLVHARPDTLRLAASGLVPPEVIARLAGMTEAELRARHGAEIAAAQRQVRGWVVRRLLSSCPG